MIHFLHWGCCDPQVFKHQNVPLWARLYQHVFCKKTSLFSSSSRYRNLGPSESACRHCAYHPNPVPLLLAAPLVIHEKNWKCLDIQAQGWHVALLKYFHRPNFLWTPAVSPASQAIDRFVVLRRLHFYLQFLLVLATGFPVTLNSYFHFFTVAGFSVLITESCEEDVEEAGVKMTWRNSFANQGQQVVGCSLHCNQFSCHFGWDVVFWPLVQW